MSSPFDAFYVASPFPSPLRAAITAAWRKPEPQAIGDLIGAARLSPTESGSARELATRLVSTLRRKKASIGRAGLVQNLLQEYALSSQEGVALMCLAEALLRIPDAATRDALIRDKIASGDWCGHIGNSHSMFVNAATWGLLVTGKLVAPASESGLGDALRGLFAKGGEPLIRKGMDMGMRVMGQQFVSGVTIEGALANVRPREEEGFRYSFDMLGEAALSEADAQRYMRDYRMAIEAIGKASNGRGVYRGPGISIKLSAIHPRYSKAQHSRVMAELYPRMLELCVLAKQYDIGMSIDAEETERLELSLDLLEKLAADEALKGWNGLGFVVQAYQRRCPQVIDYLLDLAGRTQRRLMVRLVKGAYWDSEVKRAQLDGMPGYPVYTRKPYSDISYLACARKLLGAPERVFPQFASHNAQTMASIYAMAKPETYTDTQYEFQCLHGMGEPLYEQVVGSPEKGGLGRPTRVYAPVGTHETLLAYLVRRLLENGANSSFVNRIADENVSIEELVTEPVAIVEAWAQAEGSLGLPHPSIPAPAELYAGRKNSSGIDLANEEALAELQAGLAAAAAKRWQALPMLADEVSAGALQAVKNPADHTDVVGETRDATPEEVAQALTAAAAFAPQWAAVLPNDRARLLEHAADALEAAREGLLSLLIREAGKTTPNAIAEVREAADFLRYYAAQVRNDFLNATHKPLGPVVCISPWNFPLAIFLGQISAALAAGNVVLAKPAEQTPLLAAEAVRILRLAGIPAAALQLLPGRGETVGSQLVADARVQGVVFTGSTEVARIIQATLAGRTTADGRAIPLIAETGGQNAMIVDSSALAEQVVQDAIASAFDSAGQRCSALRVLCVQEEAADRIKEMLVGAIEQLSVGNPGSLAVDVGPVIDAEARDAINAYIESRRATHRVQQFGTDSPVLSQGTFVAPTLIELKSVSELGREVFGPVLHFVRYRRADLPALIDAINATGYALTLGVHTRIDETVRHVTSAANAGNIYVNRNIVGAVVGVQPFGGEGLSGTGPKAGGPMYLYRLLAQKPWAAPIQFSPVAAPAKALDALEQWAKKEGRERLVSACTRIRVACANLGPVELFGPTGEKNLYQPTPRHRVLCVAANEDDLLVQLAGILAIGTEALWPQPMAVVAARLPAEVRAHIRLEETGKTQDFGIVMLHGGVDQLITLQKQMARRSGPVIPVERLAPGEDAIPLERLLTEKAVSINTAAAGGNASLMTMKQ
jgi:RHH-type transcriptional regulator, proline utilization regulon repressor / proline dehydrogenase / delta 1-pyrroline-5-carboxylate dehydrogenase